MQTATGQPRSPRRGLTLIELLATVALMLLIMTVIVGIFQSATGALTRAQVDQRLSTITRRIDGTLRQDLEGATARFTPPLDPSKGLGYFEYGENAHADAQGEDTDDYLAFTAKAPPGRPFTGRIMLPSGFYPPSHPRAGQPNYAPVVITSQYAEIIYFLRHGNLYRRVLLIAPERASSLQVDLLPNATYANPGGSFLINGSYVGWQGANDISVRAPQVGSFIPVPNSLGDLTNRENRSFRPGLHTDYVEVNGTTVDTSDRDGVTDDLEPSDLNGDGTPDARGNGVPDFYPTLYPNAFLPAVGRINNVPAYVQTPNLDTHAFPYVFPGMHSVPSQITAPGSVHLGPWVRPDPADTSTWVRNHSPVDVGDNLITPASTATGDNWTFWGFPTWRETRSPVWCAPLKRLDSTFSFTLPLPAPLGSTTFGPYPAAQQAYGLSHLRGPEYLTPQNHWYSDASGSATFSASIPEYAWEEDLLATNVRSFDVKAFDPNVPNFSTLLGTANLTPGYRDLGYADSLTASGYTQAEYFLATMGHAGRIPPLTTDYRVDPQWPYQIWSATPSTPNNIGDNTATTVRLQRVWDSWSTDYTNAPFAPSNPFDGAPYSQPTYTSYPPPYPSPLYGIQIQIRIVDQPESGGTPQVKVLTIRHDFSDKL